MSQNLPVVRLEQTVLLPGVSFAITADDQQTLRAIEAAVNTADHRVFALAQRAGADGPDSLYTIGTVATIGSVRRGLAGVRLFLEGQSRGIALRIAPKHGYLEAQVS